MEHTLLYLLTFALFAFIVVIAIVLNNGKKKKSVIVTTEVNIYLTVQDSRVTIISLTTEAKVLKDYGDQYLVKHKRIVGFKTSRIDDDVNPANYRILGDMNVQHALVNKSEVKEEKINKGVNNLPGYVNPPEPPEEKVVCNEKV